MSGTWPSRLRSGVTASRSLPPPWTALEDTISDGAVPVHRLPTTAQRLPQLYMDPERPHAMPIMDPRFRAGIRRLLATGGFDVLHAHDWSVNSVVGPARRAGVPVVSDPTRLQPHLCYETIDARGRGMPGSGAAGLPSLCVLQARTRGWAQRDPRQLLSPAAPARGGLPPSCQSAQ